MSIFQRMMMIRSTIEARPPMTNVKIIAGLNLQPLKTR